MCHEYSIGCRIRDLSDSERATVFYVGQVPPSSGEWLGVDWDSKDDRGRHDGCNPKDGKRYFTASGPKSGSFVRPRKVREPKRCSCIFLSPIKTVGLLSTLPYFTTTKLLIYKYAGHWRNRFRRMSK